MKRGRSKFMNKRDGNIDDKKIEEYLSSIPEQLKESDDFMLAQKGLEHLQENRSFESGDVLIKVRLLFNPVSFGCAPPTLRIK